MSQRPNFRVATRFLRESTQAVVRARASGHLTIPAVGGLIAGFVAISGGFGSNGITPTLRLAVICGAAAVIIVTSMATRSFLADRLQLATKPLWLAAFQVALMTPAAVAFCWAIAAVFQGADTPPVRDFVWPCFLTICAAETILHFARRKPANAAPSAQPSLSSRLPPPFRTSQILAVEAEDHFIRVHTSVGDTLLSMRFSDALKLLSEEPGAQTHRSWWVLRSAVSSVKRGNGRAQLGLANDLEVPVSRQFARRLRDEGWY